jgi:hypothetical protein
LALSLLREPIPITIGAALTEKAGEQSYEKHKHSATHFCPFIARSCLWVKKIKKHQLSHRYFLSVLNGIYPIKMGICRETHPPTNKRQRSG